jgi:hypothetical protein
VISLLSRVCIVFVTEIFFYFSCAIRLRVKGIAAAITFHCIPLWFHNANSPLPQHPEDVLESGESAVNQVTETKTISIGRNCHFAVDLKSSEHD